MSSLSESNCGGSQPTIATKSRPNTWCFAVLRKEKCFFPTGGLGSLRPLFREAHYVSIRPPAPREQEATASGPTPPLAPTPPPPAAPAALPDRPDAPRPPHS